MTYFIERKANDKEANKNYKNVNNKAFGLFKHGHVQKIEFAKDVDKTHVKCECVPEMKKNIKHQVKLSITNSGEIVFASCPCPAGRGPLASCKHTAAACYALEEFSRLKSTRDLETCTSRLQTWNQPRKRKLDPQSVCDIDFSKKAYGKEIKVTKSPYDPRNPSHRNINSQEVNSELLDRICKAKPNCGFFYLLSNEKVNKEPDDSSYELPGQLHDIISPIKEHPVSLDEIKLRMEKIKKKLCVSEQERDRIATETKRQSSCTEWFTHRRVRITASKCKRAILKPSTSPLKAMSEILNYNKQFQSHQMKQGFRDEKAITKMYENKVGCQVKQMGFVISSTHPFLGASPDGDTHGGLVEIKRIFVGADSSLTKALYKRRICRETSQGPIINRDHKFYYQVKLQMHCTHCKWTDLVLSDTKDMVILHIKK